MSETYYKCYKHKKADVVPCDYCEAEKKNPSDNPKESGGTKFDSEKVRMELLSPIAITEIAKVLTFGAKKYDSWNWAKGIKYSRLLGAALRHLFSFLKGEDVDPESGISHIAHAACCLVFLLHFEKVKPELDDRHKENKS